MTEHTDYILDEYEAKALLEHGFCVDRGISKFKIGDTVEARYVSGFDLDWDDDYDTGEYRYSKVRMMVVSRQKVPELRYSDYVVLQLLKDEEKNVDIPS